MSGNANFKGAGITLVTPGLWQRRLDLARTDEQVVQVARDFLASWHPLDISTFPNRCWPRRMKDADDINAYTFDVLNARFELQSDDTGLEQMSTFFSAASTRLSQIAGLARESSEEDSDGDIAEEGRRA
jgi:hypothetical protein